MRLAITVFTLVVFMGAAMLLPSAINEWLTFDRSAIHAGEFWRLLSGHFNHHNAAHYVMNMAGLVALSWVFADLLTPAALLRLVVLLVISISLGMWLDNNLQRYVGFSGVLHGLLVYVLVLGLRGNPVLHGLALAIVGWRLFLEQQPDYDRLYLAPLMDAPVYVNAHLWGAISGLAAALIVLGWRLRPSALA